MAQITCKCGNTYDSKFKFCPECAEPNPAVIKKRAKLTEVTEEFPEKPVKKKFTKVGEGSLKSAPHGSGAKKSYTIVRSGQAKPAPKEESEELYDEYEDDEESVSAYDDASEDESFDYNAEPEEELEDSEEEYEDDIEDEDYEDDEYSSEDATYDDEDDEDYEEPEIIPQPRSNKKVLTAPSVKPIKKSSKTNITKMPKTKKITATKSSLGKKKKDYDPNHDGYYDDRLPALLDEVTRTSHLDVFLKIGLSAVCIAALITYCIFYVQV